MQIDTFGKHIRSNHDVEFIRLPSIVGIKALAENILPIGTIAGTDIQNVVTMRQSAASTAKVVRSLPVGATVYPTGNKQDMWWEIADENDNVGWVNNTALAPAK